MPVVVACPACSANLRIHESALGKGRWIRCPRCTELVDIGIIESTDSLPLVECIDEDEDGAERVSPAKDPTRPPDSAARKSDIRKDRATMRIKPRTSPSPGAIQVGNTPESSSIRTKPAAKITPKPVRVETIPIADAEERDVEIIDDDEGSSIEGEDDSQLAELVEKNNWYKVRTGVHCIYVGVCLSLGSLGVLYGGAVICFAMQKMFEMEVHDFAVAFNAIAIMLHFGQFLATVAGIGFCCFAPEKQGARYLAFGTLLVAALSLALSAATLSQRESGGDWHMLAAILFLEMIKLFTFLFFLRSVAVIVRNRWLAQGILNLIATVGGLILVAILSAIFLTITRAAMTELGAIASGMKSPIDSLGGLTIIARLMTFLGATVGLGLYCWYLNSLIDIVTTLDNRFGWKNGNATGTPLWFKLMFVDGVAILASFVISFVIQRGDSSAPNTPPQQPGLVAQQPPVTPPPPAQSPMNDGNIVNLKPPSAADKSWKEWTFLLDPPADSRLSKANFERIEIGMPRQEVLVILGPKPVASINRIIPGENPNERIDMGLDTWKRGNQTVDVFYLGEKVSHKRAFVSIGPAPSTEPRPSGPEFPSPDDDKAWRERAFVLEPPKDSRLTQQNYDRIQMGTVLSQVATSLGENYQSSGERAIPSQDPNQQLRVQYFRWTNGRQGIDIYFVEGRVTKKRAWLLP